MNSILCYRLSVYVPQEALEHFVSAVSPHIPSFLGNYERVCWWSEAGTEQFCEKGAGASVQRVASMRFECAFPFDKDALSAFIEDHIKPNHPWTEPVITITTQEIITP